MIRENRVPGHPIDVILIEDTAVDAELVADALGEAGLAIALRRVQDEPTLRAALDERLPDAILADWSLPRFSGRRALTLAHERCPEVPFIFVSGTISESAAIEALRHGAVDYVYKHNRQELGPALTRALDEVRTQRLLHESLAFNRSILDSVSAEIAVLDPQGVILAVNRPWQRFALENGIEPGQPASGTEVGTNYLAVCRAGAGMAADADAVNAGNGIRAVLNGTQTDFHLEYPCHSPTQQRWFSMSVRRLEPDGRGAVITHTDITKRKQAEMALQKSKDLLQSIVDHVPARVFWKDQHSRFLGANTMFATDAGCTEPCELTGKSDFDMPWKDLAESYIADDRAVMESGAPKLRYEEPQTTPTGNTIWVRTSKVPLRDEANEVIGLLGIYEDITEERQVGEELERHRDHLEDLVRIRTRDLQDARSEADRANRAKTEFISTMSHELRSPLNAILGFAQLLEFDSPPPTPAQQDNINRILKAGWHLLTLINEILDLGKIESGKVQLALEPVSLTQVIGECCDLVAMHAQQYGIQLIIPQAGPFFTVRADPIRVKQVLINLLSNAIKYNSKQGTVQVDCAASTPGRVRVTVKDSGAGLSPEQLAQLFQPFNRLGQETGSEEGTGIGLVVTKRLVEQMGGAIGVDSAVGVGSSFWFELITADASL